MPAPEDTLVLLKPDAVQRGLVGEILARFERKGLQIAALRFMRITPELAAKHYADHEGKPFYDNLVSFMTRSPVVAAVLRGPGAIATVRKLMGATFGPDAEPGTIRGDFGDSRSFNLVHGSDSPESAAREIELFFGEDGTVEWERAAEAWIHDAEDLE